jgi:hypothetical protein
MLVGVVFAVSPLGSELIRGAFYSGESITRELSWFLLWTFGGIIAAAIVVEWLIRWWLAKRLGA